jgi:response regulator RpfG family c-di-GMP phosphodiesterase
MSQHVFIPECCILSEEAANTHFIGKLGWPDKIYDNKVKHAYHDITEAENSTMVNLGCIAIANKLYI